MTKDEKKVIQAAIRLYNRMPVKFVWVAHSYGPAHQFLWKAVAALKRGRARRRDP